MTDQDAMKRRGLVFILSSPSGAGKTSIARALLASEPDLNLSVSVTTRPPRKGEVDGTDYFFVSQERFDQMIQDKELLEHAKVFDHSYGTPKARVQTSLEAGEDILFDIDWQGTQQVSEVMAADVVRVFILPPTGTALKKRLENRAQDSQEVIQRRMHGAATEISHYFEYDYIIVNDDLDIAIGEAQAILKAERLKRERLKGLSDFAVNLQSELKK